MARRPIIDRDEARTAAKPVNTDGDDRPEFNARAASHLEQHGIVDGYSDGNRPCDVADDCSNHT